MLNLNITAIVCFVAGVVLTTLYFSMSLQPQPPSSISVSTAVHPQEQQQVTHVTVSATSQDESQNAGVPFSLRSAFACSPKNCFTDEAVRIAFVGDSITYGNGTHDGRMITDKAGVWPMDVALAVRNQGDRCVESVALRENRTSASKRTRPTRRRYSADIRNYGVERMSVSCDMNPIAKQQKFLDAVAFRPHVAVIAMGTNDCHASCCCACEWSVNISEGDCNKCKNPRRRCTVPFNTTRFYLKLRELVDAFVNVGTEHVILVTPPPMIDALFVRAWVFQFELIAQEIVPTIRKLAADRRLRLVDIHASWAQRHDDLKSGLLLFRDGIHPTQYGHLRIAAQFMRTICQL